MSSHANTVKLSPPVLAALQEAAKREHKSLEEMAGEAIMRGLSAERDTEWRDLIGFGHAKGKESGIREEDIPEVIHQSREAGRRHNG